MKRNLLAPMEIDMSALKSSDGKNPIRPNAPLGPDNNVMAMRALLAASVPQQLAVEMKETGYRLWVESTAKAVSSFENDMNNLKASTAPAKVMEAKKNLTAVANIAINDANSFIGATEDLSREASALRTTAALGDDAIVLAAVKVFEEVAAKVLTAGEKGLTASNSILKLESSVTDVDAALSWWLSDMKAEQAHDQSQLDDATRLRDNAQRDKDNMKNDYWYCFLGPIACITVAIEATVRINNAQSEINAYISTISNVNKSLSDLLATINDTTSVTGHAVALSTVIDGGLKALQVVKSTVDGINATVHSLTPFVVRAHLNAVAAQIEGVATVKLAHSGRMLFQAIAVVVDTGFIGALQKLASSAMMVQFSALTSSKQPKLVYVESLLKQDQALLRGHALEWIATYSNNVLSVFSAIRAVGDIIKYIGTEVLELANKGDINNVTAGIDSMAQSLSNLLVQRLMNDTFSIKQFNENIKNDQLSFNTVAEILREKLGSSSGELATMEVNETTYSTAIKQSLSDKVNNSTRIICEHLAWGLVLAVSIGIGQVQFVTVAAPTVMYLLKTGANIVVKSASEGVASKAKGELMKFEAKGENIDTLISKRSDNLEKISKLTADMAIVKVLVDDTSTMKINSAAILTALGSIQVGLRDKIQQFYAIKYALKGSKPSDAVAKLTTALETWEEIQKAADLLEKTFMASFYS